MQHEADRDIRSTVVRVAGGLVGLAIVLAIIAPFDGVPPRPGSSDLAPAQIEVRVVQAGAFDIDPVGTVLEPTSFPPPGRRGGPTLAVTVRNIAGIPLRVRVRLLGLSPSLDNAAKVRGSVAGSVVLNGPLGRASEWSRPSGVLRSGQQSTLRMRFKLLDVPPEQWRGQLDVRQLEFESVRADGLPNARPEPRPTTPTTTSPAPTEAPPATTPPPKLGPPLPGTQTVMGTVMESATSNSAQNATVGPPPTTPVTTTP